ncbi:MAG: hypothetical protein IJT59_07805 [Desulfovibrionaceae bacterium]|nr:hypothetical protein [Desulfovibrionaceae bacterium]
MPKRILFYGDSNTWGYIEGGGRFSAEIRFPMVVQSLLPGSLALEEGLNGRNACFNHPLSEPSLLGGKSFAKIFEQSLPVEALVLMLGTNDALPPLYRQASEICADLLRIVLEARKITPNLPILLLAPAPVADSWLEEFEEEMGAAQMVRLEPLAVHFEALAKQANLAFFDVASLIPRADARDGLHLSATAHKLLGQKVAEILRDLLK